MRTSSLFGPALAFSTGRSPSERPAAGRVLVVDDSPGNLDLLQRLLEREGHTVFRAGDGLEALHVVQNQPPDIVITDVVMPRQNGLDLCRAIKANAATRLVPVVLLTGLSGTDERIEGIEAGADDFICKPFDAHELRARVRSLLRIKRYTDELDSAEAVIMSLALTVEARDACTEGHCQRLAQFAVALGSRLGLSEDDLGALQRGGVLHDIGKVGIPDAILLKPGRLTPEEFAQMKTHTVIGDRVCSQLRLLEKVRPIVRHHHERLDGSGYPDGLRGDAVPLLAQIVGIVDVYDALTTDRPYRGALSSHCAFEELSAESQRGWRDTVLVAEFIGMCQDGMRGR
jgi:putative two-component system response regulator